VAQDGSNISSQALALLQMKLPNGQYLYPTPQRIDGGQGSYSASIPCPFYEEQFMTNADWNQSKRASGRYVSSSPTAASRTRSPTRTLAVQLLRVFRM
jgi:hypothetical protein